MRHKPITVAKESGECPACTVCACKAPNGDEQLPTANTVFGCSSQETADPSSMQEKNDTARTEDGDDDSERWTWG